MEKVPMIPERVLQEILQFARDAGVERLVLFGSRARGTYSERSDIDLAVYGGDFDAFYFRVQEETESLLEFDLIDMHRKVSPSLLEDIEREGIEIYEKD
jgi:Nucleotidyltransferase domain.